MLADSLLLNSIYLPSVFQFILPLPFFFFLIEITQDQKKHRRSLAQHFAKAGSAVGLELVAQGLIQLGLETLQGLFTISLAVIFGTDILVQNLFNRISFILFNIHVLIYPIFAVVLKILLNLS